MLKNLLSNGAEDIGLVIAILVIENDIVKKIKLCLRTELPFSLDILYGPNSVASNEEKMQTDHSACTLSRPRNFFITLVS